MITKPPSAVRRLQPRLLLGPGPSPVSQRIRDTMALPTVGHLDPGFLQVMDEVSAGLRAACGTNSPSTFALSATGSAGMEASLANVI